MIRPAVIGLAGSALSVCEVEMLRVHRPLGVILFRRNIEAPDQLAALVSSVRAALGDHALLMIDQEGGRVARLRPPFWRAHPPAALHGALHRCHPHAALRAAYLTGLLIGAECRWAGFDVVCAPVLDRHVPGAHDIVGDRAFGADAQTVAALAGCYAEGLLAGGVQPVGKHAPGHGRAQVDSHLDLPELDDVDALDLLPFQANSWLPWMMTAHILYRELDPARPATLSPIAVDTVIRGRIGFGNVLVSDDLAMSALSGAPGARAAAALAAGNDVALHCSGVIEESLDVLRSMPEAASSTLDRLARARALAEERRLAEPDLDALAAERDALLAEVGTRVT